MKTGLLVSMTIAASLCLHPVQAQEKKENDKSEIRGSLSVTTDSWDGSGETQIQYVEDGQRYKIRLKGSKITEMYLNDRKVAEEDFPKYEALVKKIMVQVEKDRVQAQKDREQAEIDREQANRDRQQAERDRGQAEKDRQQAEKDRVQADRDRETAIADRRQAEKDRAQAELDRKQAEKDREQAEVDRKQAEKDRAQAEEDRKLFNAMVDELVKEKLIESRDALTSLELDDTELVINGKQQPASVHKQFKEKYLKGKNNRMQYRHSGTTRNFSFN